MVDATTGEGSKICMSHPNRINERQLETNVLADAAAINDGILSEMPDEKGPGAARCECHLVVEILAKNIIEQVARSGLVYVRGRWFCMLFGVCSTSLKRSGLKRSGVLISSDSRERFA